MGVIHRFTGRDGGWDWEGVPVQSYKHALPGVTARKFITRRDGADNFEMRYFELEPGACSQLESHVHDHGVVVLRGRGTVQIGQEFFPIRFGDAIHIASGELHQFTAAPDEQLGFLCVVLDERLRQYITPGTGG